MNDFFLLLLFFLSYTQNWIWHWRSALLLRPRFAKDLLRTQSILFPRILWYSLILRVHVCLCVYMYVHICMCVLCILCQGTFSSLDRSTDAMLTSNCARPTNQSLCIGRLHPAIPDLHGLLCFAGLTHTAWTCWDQPGPWSQGWSSNAQLNS